MKIQKIIIILIMMVVFVGCGKEVEVVEEVDGNEVGLVEEDFQGDNVKEDQEIIVREEILENEQVSKVKKLETELESLEKQIEEDMRYRIYNFVCPEKIEEAIIDMPTEYPYPYNGYEINGKNFDLKKDAKNEINKHQYNIVNACLYNNEDRVFKYNLLVQSGYGFLRDKSKELGKSQGVKGLGLGGLASEWYRVENDNKLYIFLKGVTGCMGCVFNGPYLVIDLNTNEINGNYFEMPSFLNLVLSPDKEKAIELFIDDNGEQKLYVYNMITQKREKLIFEIPKNRTVSGEFFPAHDFLKWTSDNTVNIQLYYEYSHMEDYSNIAETVSVNIENIK